MKFSAADAIVLAGIGSTGYGLWLVYPPLTFLSVGGVLMFLGVWLQRTRVKQ